MQAWTDRRRRAVMGIYSIDCMEENVEAMEENKNENNSETE